MHHHTPLVLVWLVYFETGFHYDFNFEVVLSQPLKSWGHGHVYLHPVCKGLGTKARQAVDNLSYIPNHLKSLGFVHKH